MGGSLLAPADTTLERQRERWGNDSSGFLPGRDGLHQGALAGAGRAQDQGGLPGPEAARGTLGALVLEMEPSRNNVFWIT